jgi:exodeoxyribonuclease VII large subunit
VTASEPTSAEQPWPVRTVARKIAQWIDRLGWVWVEGQVTQVSARPGTGTAFLTLRDPAADVSITLTCATGMVTARRITDGSRLVVHGKPTFFLNRGTLSLRVDEIREVGVGELLARIERLRRELTAEGLFDPARRRRPPFLPRRVGLITGRASAAERDVVTNAKARWPAVEFRLCNVAVQGVHAVPQIVDALATLDRDPDVDVIVLARGGGSVEDLLPFSDETLCRAVAATRTPVLSAIGHESDNPLVDLVADVRCSTPTDAGKRVVPDMAVEVALVEQLRARARRALHGWVDRERRLLDALRSRPVLADPRGPIEARETEVAGLRDRARRAVQTAVLTAEGTLIHTVARLTALGPAATLARGYAIVQRSDVRRDTPGDGHPVLRSVHEAPPGTRLRVRLVDGALHAVVAYRDDSTERDSNGG